MTTLNEMINLIKIENPTLKRGNDNNGYESIDDDEYNSIITQWAESRLEKEITEQNQQKAKEAAKAKLEALGLTLDDLAALGF